MTMPAIHGFYYTKKKGEIYGLKLTPGQQLTMQKVWQRPFQVVPYELYWRKLARYMMTHAPQGYVAWEGISHWIIGNCGRIVREPTEDADADGVNLIQFLRDRTITFQWFPRVNPEDDEDNPVNDLVFTPWDWLLEGQGDEEMFPLSTEQKQEISENVKWTYGLHDELEKKWPRDDYWE
jgi:hypothetical protein